MSVYKVRVVVFVFNTWILNNIDEQMPTTAEPSLQARQRPAHLDVLTHLILRTAWWKWGCNIILIDSKLQVGKRGTKRVNRLLVLTQLVNGGAGFELWPPGSRHHAV